MRTILYSLKEFFLIPVEFFQNATKLTYLSLGVAIIVGLLYGKIMFLNRNEFDGPPDDLNDGTNFQWVKWKALAFLFLCFGSYLLAYNRLPVWLPSLFQH